jgi:hypothetical protein
MYLAQVLGLLGRLRRRSRIQSRVPFKLRSYPIIGRHLLSDELEGECWNRKWFGLVSSGAEGRQGKQEGHGNGEMGTGSLCQVGEDGLT